MGFRTFSAGAGHATWFFFDGHIGHAHIEATIVRRGDFDMGDADGAGVGSAHQHTDGEPVGPLVPVEGILLFGEGLLGNHALKERQAGLHERIAESGTDVARGRSVPGEVDGCAVPPGVADAQATIAEIDRDEAEHGETVEIHLEQGGHGGGGIGCFDQIGDQRAARAQEARLRRVDGGLKVDIEHAEHEAAAAGADPGAAAEGVGGPDGAGVRREGSPLGRKGRRAGAFFVAVGDEPEAGSVCCNYRNGAHVQEGSGRRPDGRASAGDAESQSATGTLEVDGARGFAESGISLDAEFGGNGLHHGVMMNGMVCGKVEFAAEG